MKVYDQDSSRQVKKYTRKTLQQISLYNSDDDDDDDGDDVDIT